VALLKLAAYGDAGTELSGVGVKLSEARCEVGGEPGARLETDVPCEGGAAAAPVGVAVEIAQGTA
jgi:hypothetical protein